MTNCAGLPPRDLPRKIRARLWSRRPTVDGPFLRLVSKGEELHWQTRGHFFGAAAEAMRRILVESARRKNRTKRGGGWRRVDLAAQDLPVRVPSDEIVALDEALNRLTEEDSVAAKVVQLHFFAGLSIEQAADALRRVCTRPPIAAGEYPPAPRAVAPLLCHRRRRRRSFMVIFRTSMRQFVGERRIVRRGSTA